MSIRLSTALRTDRANTVLTALDAALTPGTIEFYAGGQPDPDSEISSIAAWAASTAYVVGEYISAVGHYYRAEQAGTTAATQPTWPTDGSTVLDGDITWQDMGEMPVLLGTLTLSQPCGTVADGVLTFAAITEDTAADANGLASWARLRDGDGTPVLDLPLGGPGSGMPIELNTTNIVAGGPLRITALSWAEGGA